MTPEQRPEKVLTEALRGLVGGPGFLADTALKALREAGFRVAELPKFAETNTYESGGEEITVWTWPTGVCTDNDTKTLFDDNGIEIGSPDEAREYAADILAAADVAEAS